MRHAVRRTEIPDSGTRLTINHWALSTALNGALTLRDVKNEDRPGYMHENTGDDDKMSSEKHGFYTKMHQLHDNRQQSSGLIGRKCSGYAIIRGEGEPKIGSSAHRSIGGARSWFLVAR